MPASKADQVQKAKRVQAAVKALLQGNTVQELVIAMQEQYGIGQTQAYEYAKEATSEIHRKIEGELSDHINQHYKRLELLYADCIRDKDRRTARMVLKDMSELIGMDAPKRTDITTGGEKFATFVDILGTENPAGEIKPTKKPEDSAEKHDDIQKKDKS